MFKIFKDMLDQLELQRKCFMVHNTLMGLQITDFNALVNLRDY